MNITEANQTSLLLRVLNGDPLTPTQREEVPRVAEALAERVYKALYAAPVVDAAAVGETLRRRYPEEPAELEDILRSSE